MSLDLNGIGYVVPQEVNISVSSQHPLVKHCQALDWERLFGIILPDLKSTTAAKKMVAWEEANCTYTFGDISIVTVLRSHRSTNGVGTRRQCRLTVFLWPFSRYIMAYSRSHENREGSQSIKPRNPAYIGERTLQHFSQVRFWRSKNHRLRLDGTRSEYELSIRCIIDKETGTKVCKSYGDLEGRDGRKICKILNKFKINHNQSKKLLFLGKKYYKRFEGKIFCRFIQVCKKRGLQNIGSRI